MSSFAIPTLFQVSKLMQPSVIFIDQAEKTFLKKVSKTDKSDPKRLKKDLPRLVRSLAGEDRVLLVGNSRSPWECEQKVSDTFSLLEAAAKKMYGKMRLLLEGGLRLLL